VLRTQSLVRVHTITEAIARRMLARNGIAPIWQLQVAAGIAYQNGNLGSAANCVKQTSYLVGAG
jgi:hypothetical protein